MDDMTKFLRRANLKELACYFTNLDLPIEEDLPPDSTVEELMEEVYGHLEAALLRGDSLLTTLEQWERFCGEMLGLERRMGWGT